MRRFVIVGLLLSLSFTAFAQDEEKNENQAEVNAKVEEILKKAQARLYTTKDSGITDCRVELDAAPFAMFLQGAKLVYYFKVPKKKVAPISGTGTDEQKVELGEAQSVLKIEGGAGGDPFAQIPALKNLIGKIAQLLDNFFGVTNPVKELQEQKKHCTFKLELKDGKHIVTVIPNKNAPKKKFSYTKQVLTFDENYKLIAGKAESNGATNAMTPTFIEKNGKLLLAGMKVSAGGMAIDVTVEWQQLEEKYWVPKKMVQKVGGQLIEFNLQGYKINKGVEDKVFKK